MKYDDFDERNYAKWTDVTTPVAATINDMREEEMPRSKEKKLVAYFPEEQFRFGVVLNKINRRTLAQITGSENPMDAIGTRVELYNDPTVRNPQTGEYGAVRIRCAPVREQPAVMPANETLDEVSAESVEIPY